MLNIFDSLGSFFKKKRRIRSYEKLKLPIDHEKENIKSALRNSDSPKVEKRARFVTKRPITEYEPKKKANEPVKHHIKGSLGDMYGHLMSVRTAKALKDVVVMQVNFDDILKQHEKTPDLYLPDEDAQSTTASIIYNEEDEVITVHDFKARTSVELDIQVGDIVKVLKRQGMWMYGCYSGRTFENDVRIRSNHQTKPSNNHGWFPSTFVTKF